MVGCGLGGELDGVGLGDGLSLVISGGLSCDRWWVVESG